MLARSRATSARIRRVPHETERLTAAELARSLDRRNPEVALGSPRRVPSSAMNVNVPVDEKATASACICTVVVFCFAGW